VYLHYRPMDQLELERFGKGCTLVVPRVILGELNKHKDSHSSKTIRNRARAVCKSIHGWSDSGKVSGSLAFEFDIRTSSPQTHGLDQLSSDDRFLSDILEHPAPLSDKLLVSNDSNLCLTAKHLGIPVEEIDERLRLPVELDPAEKEARKLQRELDRLQNARPQLEIGLVGDESQVNVEANPVFPLRPGGPELTDEMIEYEVEEKRRSLCEKHMPSPHQKGFAIPLAMGVSATEINAYNQKLDGYPDKYRQYLRARREFLARPMYRFTIAIANIGTAPAQNVDIYLYFPDGFELYEAEDIPSGPQEPSLPEKPISAIERLQRSTLEFHLPKYMLPKIDHLSSFSLKRTNSYDVSDSFSVIKHNERACLPELYLQFASTDAAKAFRCDYRITVDNLPDEIRGSINFQFVSDDRCLDQSTDNSGST